MRKTRSFFDADTRRRTLDRLRSLTAESPARWGRMTAPEMVAHLSDQMRHALGDRHCTPTRSRLRWPGMRYLAIYWVPWPKGRLKGPPDAFVSRPTSWAADVKALEGMIERFAESDPAGDWPDHGLFGPMSGRDWGAFCYRHFDHHLRQFGV